MEEMQIVKELRHCEDKRENLRNVMEKLKSYASDVLVFNLQWCDVEDCLKSVEERVEKRLMELVSKEKELQSRSFAIEERAKVVEAAEAKMGDLEMKANLIMEEIEEKRKEFDFLKNQVEICLGEFKAEEMRLTKLRKSVEECTVEERSKASQHNELVESLRKIQVEIDLKGEQLAQMETVLERHRAEVSSENVHLGRTQARSRELEEEIERKRKDLKAVLDRIAECEKQRELVEEQLYSQQKLLDARSSELISMERKLGELSLDLDLREELVKSLNGEMEETVQKMGSKVKKLEDMERLIQESSAHYESIKLLIEEHTEELASKEKKQNEISEAIHKLSLEIISEEKTLERARVFTQQLSGKHHAKERKLELTRRHLEKWTIKYHSKKNELRSVKGRLKGCLQDLEIKEREATSLQSLFTEINKQVDEGEKTLRHLHNSNEELSKKLQVKQEELCSINKAIKECSGELEFKRNHRDQVQSSISDLTAELKSKECDLISVKKKIQDNLKDFQSKEEQQVRLKASLMEREKELGLKQKALDQQLKSMEQKLAKCAKDYEQKAKKLSCFCQQSNPDQQVDLVRDLNVCDEKTLQFLLRGHLKKCSQLHLEILRALKASSDPAKLVLDTIQGIYSAHQRMAATNLDPNSVRRSSICLLECLMDMSPKPSTEVQGEAIKFATEWKDTTLVQAENPVEVLGFLHSLAAFSTAYTFDTEKVHNLFDVTLIHKYAPSLCKAIGVPINNVLSLGVKPEQQPSEAPNLASSHLAIEDALMDHEGSASFSPNEVFTGLQFIKDPSSFVLNFVNDALMSARQRGELGLAEPIVKNLVPLLEELPRVVRSSDHLQSEAREVANLWSLMMGTSAQISPLEAWGFLHLIVAYGLVDLIKQDQTLQFASYVAAHFRQAPKLLQSLGLSYAIPDFVKLLLNERHSISAIRFIYYFNLENMFSSPLELLKEEIINLRLHVKEKRRYESQAEERDAAKFRDIIELIKDFKVEIDLPGDLIVKFMVPREAYNQNQYAVVSSLPTQLPQILPPVHMQASHPVIDSSTHGLNPSLPTIFGETSQAGGSTAFQGQSSQHAGFKRPRVDPRVPSSAIRPCFNPSSGSG